MVHAFQAAFAAIVHTPIDDVPSSQLERTLAAAVRCGGDTVAAIAGSLLGARWGATALPVEWHDILHGRISNTKPSITSTTLARMARLAFTAGCTDGPIGDLGLRAGAGDENRTRTISLGS